MTYLAIALVLYLILMDNGMQPLKVLQALAWGLTWPYALYTLIRAWRIQNEGDCS